MIPCHNKLLTKHVAQFLMLYILIYKQLIVAMFLFLFDYFLNNAHPEPYLKKKKFRKINKSTVRLIAEKVMCYIPFSLIGYCTCKHNPQRTIPE